MDSKKTTEKPRHRRWRIHIPYKWRVLLPTLGVMWLGMLSLALYQHASDAKLRQANIRRPLERVTANVVDAYASGKDVAEFVKFVDEYFSNTYFTGLRVSVYDYTGKLVASAGEPIPYELKDYDMIDGDKLSHLPPEVQKRVRENLEKFDHTLSFYESQLSYDGKIHVLTAMPTNSSIELTLSRTNRIWFVIFPIILIASIISYIYVSYITRSLRLLTSFADHAAEGTQFDQVDNFPDDEFGRISSQIVRLYHDKTVALEQTEREKAITINAIKEKSRFINETTSNINHELKTPVGIMKGYIETILSQPDMDREQIYHFLQRAEENAVRLSSLLADVSTITRLEGGSSQIVITEFNFHDVVYSIAADIEATQMYAPFEFKYDVPLIVNVFGNPTLIHNVLHNLMRNAVHHSGGTMMGVEYIGETPTHYKFRFYDNGRGVPEESIAHLFERFYRVDKGRSRKMGDTGLGLSIVQSTFEAIGGMISVKNRSTGGLEFIFTLPKAKPGNPGTDETES